jgi:hypothetical protein
MLRPRFPSSAGANWKRIKIELVSRSQRDTHWSGATILDPTPTSESCRSLSTVPEELDVTIGAPEDET